MENFTSLKNPVLAAEGASSFRLSWSRSGPGSASSAATAGREKMNLLLPRTKGSSRMVNVGCRPAPACPRVRSSAKVMMIMGKYKGTQMREKQLTEMIEKKVIEAKEVCGKDDKSDECKVAWDEVEEVSQAKADLRLKLEIMHQDPLESFCQENPETDECRIYED